MGIQQKKEIKKEIRTLRNIRGHKNQIYRRRRLYRDITEEYASERRRIFKPQTYRLREKKRQK